MKVIDFGLSDFIRPGNASTSFAFHRECVTALCFMSWDFFCISILVAILHSIIIFVSLDFLGVFFLDMLAILFEKSSLPS